MHYNWKMGKYKMQKGDGTVEHVKQRELSVSERQSQVHDGIT